jgi:drug/metabolite transporter (DMT)-like permease
MVQFVAILCVVGLAIGQILFKVSAISFNQAGNLFASKPLVILFFAMSLYACTSIAWVWVLQKAELGRVYPFMALAFALVPLGSYIFLGERFHSQYFLVLYSL